MGSAEYVKAADWKSSSCSHDVFPMALNLKEQRSHGRFQALELALAGPFCSTSYDLNFNPGIKFFLKKSYAVRCEYGQLVFRSLKRGVAHHLGGCAEAHDLYFQLTSTYWLARGSTGSEATLTGDLISRLFPPLLGFIFKRVNKNVFKEKFVPRVPCINYVGSLWTNERKNESMSSSFPPGQTGRRSQTW